MARVCHMTSAHNNNDVRIFKKECISLAKAGYEVYLVGPGESRKDNGVIVYGIEKRPRRLARMLFTSHDVYRRALYLDADIYHLHDPELLPYGVKLAKKGKQVIFDSHENYPEQIKNKTYLPKCTRNLLGSSYYHYETHAVSFFSAAITPCTFNGKSIFEGRAKRVAFVGNKALLNSKMDISSRDNLASSICCLGSLTYDRGITHLVKAAYEAGVKLILCGPISKSYLKELQSMPEFINTDYRGVLESEKLPVVMAECFAGVAVGLNKGQYLSMDTLPTKVADYMLNGLPVLLYRSPFNERFIEESNCGIIVDTADVQSFARAINEMKQWTLRDNTISERCCLYAKKNLLWNIDEKALLDLYNEIDTTL